MVDEVQAFLSQPVAHDIYRVLLAELAKIGCINHHSTARTCLYFFVCEERGKVGTKDDLEIEMYFAVGVIPALAATTHNGRPQEFAARYESYFRRPLPAFPACLLPRAVGQTV